MPCVWTTFGYDLGNILSIRQSTDPNGDIFFFCYLLKVVLHDESELILDLHSLCPSSAKFYEVELEFCDRVDTTSAVSTIGKFQIQFYHLIRLITQRNTRGNALFLLRGKKCQKMVSYLLRVSVYFLHLAKMCSAVIKSNR